ncbi:MAG: hypothetical protein LBN05_08115 [Oscillospiraceae bacterium]|jgi:hypothetical protein|nr:hypothetical protein [Oscillospiraceae bacterium]
MKFGKKALAIFLAALFLMSTCAAAAFGLAAGVTQSTDPIALNDPLEAFSRLPSFGTELASPSAKGFPEDIIVVNSNHIQGVARYGAYTIISVSGDSSISSTGYFFFFSDQKLLGGFPSPEGLGTHTGAVSVAGDYLACSTGTTLFYDLSPLKSGNLPSATPVLQVGGVGSTIAIADYNGAPALYAFGGDNLKVLSLPLSGASTITELPFADQSQPSEYDGTGQWGTLNAWTSDNDALVADTAGNLWFFSLNSKLTLNNAISDLIGENGMNYEDVALLYKIDLSSGTATLTGPLATKKLEPYDSYLFALGSHFRFAASVQVFDADNFAIVSTPSLPGNLFLDAVNGTAKNVLDLVRPNTLCVNAYTTRPVGEKAPPSFLNIESRGFLNWLYQLLYRFLSIVNLEGVLGKLGIKI